MDLRSRAKYKPLRAVDDERNEHDSRFDDIEEDIPWGAIGLAVFLTLFGIVSFVLAWLHVTQRLLGKEQAEFGFTLLGALTFIPGAYHLWLAYGAWRGYRGYSYSRIPQY